MITATKDCYYIQQNPFLRFLSGSADFDIKLTEILKGRNLTLRLLICNPCSLMLNEGKHQWGFHCNLLPHNGLFNATKQPFND